MTDGVHTELDTRDGRPVVVKRAEGPAARHRLQREAERLGAARHPGVVELLDGLEDDGSLVLAWAGGQTLASARPDVVTATALLAEVAATLADLHQRGLVHGRLDPTHVVVDGHGRPRLCGLAGPDVDASEPDPTETDDVEAVGHLIERLVGTGSEPEPIPDRRWGRRPWTGYQARAVQTLADQATSPEVSRRPTARTLAAALADLVPDDRRPTRAADEATTPHPAPTDDPTELVPPIAPAPTIDTPPEPALGPATILGMRIHEDLDHEAPRARERWRPPESELRRRTPRPSPSPWATTAARAGVAAIGLLAVGLAVVRLGPSGSEAVDAPPAEALAPSPTTTSPTTTPLATTTTIRCPGGGGLGPGATADIDGDGCPEAATIGDGRITVGTTSYTIGRPDDEVALGDWDCDGTATPALLRPGSGELFVFSRWPDPATPLTLTATTTVPQAAHLAGPTTGCGTVTVQRTDGTDVELDLTSPEEAP